MVAITMVLLLTNSIINNGMEYVYRLNLPPLLDVLIRDLIKDIDDNPKVISTIKPQDYFNDEILQLKNFHWDRCNCFKRTNNKGPIHIDGFGDDGDNLIWGINWVHGAPGNMEYWDDSLNLTRQLTFDVAGKARIDIIPNGPASKIYPTVPGGVYLINASIPHLANNYSLNTRYAVSLRTKDSKLDWDQVISLFSDLII